MSDSILYASSRLYFKLIMPITDHNMIKMGGVIQGEITRKYSNSEVLSTASIN